MSLPASFDALLGHRHTLLLQGPMGPFFAKLAKVLRAQGQQVFKVNFNGGDQLFFRGQNVCGFDGEHASWGRWLRDFIVAHRITVVVLFGQGRPIHQPVAEIAKQTGVQLFVFEEGYLRPNYVTLEVDGVNGHSGLPRDRAFYDSIPLIESKKASTPAPAGQHFFRTAAYAMAYSLAKAALGWCHPHDVYHRPLRPGSESVKWLRGGIRKVLHRAGDRSAMKELTTPERSGRWFLLPLQVHNDCQILRHSRFARMEAAIDEVMASFAANAAVDHWLVIKHHPMDRAYRDYTSHIATQAQCLGIAGRVRYVHDSHLPTLLKHTRGVVTVNSTTGLQALHHQKPVMTLGECFYAVDGLVHAGSLAGFWRSPGVVDTALFQRFCQHLIRHTQLNASFYARAPGFDFLSRPSLAIGGADVPGGISDEMRVSTPGNARTGVEPAPEHGYSIARALG